MTASTRYGVGEMCRCGAPGSQGPWAVDWSPLGTERLADREYSSRRGNSCALKEHPISAQGKRSMSAALGYHTHPIFDSEGVADIESSRVNTPPSLSSILINIKGLRFEQAMNILLAAGPSRHKK